MELGHAHDGEDKTRQARAGTEVDEHPRLRRQERIKLGGVKDMPAPYIAHRVPANEIDPLVPARQQIDIGREAVERFT